MIDDVEVQSILINPYAARQCYDVIRNVRLYFLVKR